MIPTNFYKEETGRLRAEMLIMEKENHRLRAAIFDFCERWDEGLGGDSKFMDRLRSSLSPTPENRTP